MNGCIYHDDNGVQCERDPGHKGKHAYDLAMGGQHEWTGGLVPAARIAELERAAETTRAEHATALGLATARIQELEGKWEQLLKAFGGIKCADLGCTVHMWGSTELPRFCPAHNDKNHHQLARIEKAAKERI